MTYINKHFIVIILSYNLIIISTIFGSPIKDKEYFNRDVKYFFMDESRYEFLEDKGSYIKDELKKLNKNFLNEFGEFPVKKKIIEEAVYETYYTGKGKFPNNRLEDAYLTELLALRNPSEQDDQYLKLKYGYVFDVRKKLVTPRKEFEKHISFPINEIVSYDRANWEQIIEFYGGHTKLIENGIDKSMLSDFGYSAILKDVELFSRKECFANVSLDYNSEKAKDFYNFKKVNYKYRGMIKTSSEELNIKDLENYSSDNTVLFSFPEKKYMPKKDISISLKKLLNKDINQIVNKYIKAVNMLFDDTIDNKKFINIQAKEQNEIKGAFIEIHQIHQWNVDDIIKYYGKNDLYPISNKKRVLNLLKSDKSDVDEAVKKIAVIKDTEKQLKELKLVLNEAGKDELNVNRSLAHLKAYSNEFITQQKNLKASTNATMILVIVGVVGIILIVRNNPWILDIIELFSGEDDEEEYYIVNTGNLNNQKHSFKILD